MSLRAERSNPESIHREILDCFVARAPRNDAEAAGGFSMSRCHSPRRRGIQYAAASRFNHCRLGVLDRPVLMRNCALAGR
ncbi:hypothetical protein C7G42_18850 [Bradyrhizobium sp. MOS003]|nr:hypothetical protein C7G42_18850 [Bradyrhizobium sp. MOS003]